MNTKIITAIALACVLTSCSSLYKATSTPDDVYFSPAPAVQVKDAKSGEDVGYDQYENYQTSNDDRYLRMKVSNNALWSGIDDYSYWQDSRYDFGFSCNSSRYALLNSFYSPYSYGMYSAYNPLLGFGLGNAYYGYGGGGGYWGSPYQTVVLYKNPKTYFGTTNKGNLTAYRNPQYSNSNYYKNGSNSNYGNGAYSNRNNTYYNNSNNSYQPARSFSNSSSSNSAGGHSGGFNSSGSSAPASRPTRH